MARAVGALGRKGIEAAVDVYAGSLKNGVLSHTVNGDVHLIMMTVFSIGYPKGRPAGAVFIEEMKKSGFIQQTIKRASLKGAVVPDEVEGSGNLEP